MHSPILFISTNDHVPWGGSEVLWSRVAKRLVDLGHEVIASVWKWEPEAPALVELRKAGVRLHLRHREQRVATRLHKAWEVYRKGYFRSHSDNELEAFGTFKPEHVVFSIGNHLDLKFVRMSKRCRQDGIPYDVVVQLVHLLAVVTDDRADALIEAYSGARNVVFVSEQNRTMAKTHLGHGFPNSVVIPNPIDITGPGIVPYPSVEDGWSLAMVGALTPFHKGQDIILEVLSQTKWKQRPLHLNIYGEGQSRRTLERLVRNNDLQQVKLHGFVSDRHAIWSQNHAALFASRMEGLSLALLEAMACGRMVVSTDVGGAKEWVRHGTTGFIVQGADAFLLDLVLEEAWNAREFWAAMGREAYGRYRDQSVIDPVQNVLDVIGISRER